VLEAAGLKMADLFNNSCKAQIDTYDYCDEPGKLLYQVVRYVPKDFRLRRPDGNGGWIPNLKGVRRVLYRLSDVLKAKSVLVAEGEKDCETAHKMGLVATCNAGGAGKWRENYSECLRGKHVAIIADADEPGRKHAQQVAKSLRSKAESVKVLELPGAKDLSLWVEKGGTRERLVELIRGTPEWTGQPSSESEKPLIVLTVDELFMREIKPREMLLAPILPEQGLAMLYAYRGIGKTHLALGIAAAVASGTRFLRWAAPRPRRVLYVDGELPAITMREWLAMILLGVEQGEPAADALGVVTPDLQERPMPDLATPEGQHSLEPHLAGIDLLVLDNLSSLCRYGNENEGEGWLPVQEWALGLRRRGMAVLFVHHAGKNKSQRGTSRREDLLDTVITLKHPADYSRSEGLRCEVHFEKTRSMLGDAAKPFEVRMENGSDGRAVWSCRELEDVKSEQAAALFSAQMSVREVAEELGISKTQAGRFRQRWSAGRLLEVSHHPTA
jgi:putative DNA primase/helicase